MKPEPLHGYRLHRAMKKAAHLQVHEGKAREEAIAMAVAMERAHRLTDEGKYIEVGDDRG